jgi:3-methylcrotonyl-CoA carboxylase alpha subunit
LLCTHVPGGWRFGGKAAARLHLQGDRATLLGSGHVITRPDPAERQGAAAPAGEVVTAPMPGLLREVFVRVGAEVAVGDRVAVMEAMKMEHTLRAPRAGTVAEVPQTAGSQIAVGALIMSLEPEA